jgi:hypothetical protein
MEWKNEYALDGFTTPIREEVLQRRGDTVMTRNSYGAHCLNTERVAIADVDLPETPPALRFPAVTLVLLALAAAWLAQLAPHKNTSRMVATVLVVLLLLLAMRRVQRWWETRQARQRAASAPPSAQAMERVQAFHHSHPDWGLRVYETPNGLRVIVTHTDFAPEDPAVGTLFDALQVDPLYALLCERQQCFRARVSGKPWRMGLTGLSTSLRRWPIPEAMQEDRQQWALAYDEKARGFAACRLLQQLGDTQACASAQAFIEWHDEASRAGTNLPLA